MSAASSSPTKPTTVEEKVSDAKLIAIPVYEAPIWRQILKSYPRIELNRFRGSAMKYTDYELLFRIMNRICNIWTCGATHGLQTCSKCLCTFYCCEAHMLQDQPVHSKWCANPTATSVDEGPLGVAIAPVSAVFVLDKYDK
jgi:hypothetical protein